MSKLFNSRYARVLQLMPCVPPPPSQSFTANEPDRLPTVYTCLPMYVKAITQAVKYWCRLDDMYHGPLVRVAYIHEAQHAMKEAGQYFDP